MQSQGSATGFGARNGIAYSQKTPHLASFVFAGCVSKAAGNDHGARISAMAQSPSVEVVEERTSFEKVAALHAAFETRLALCTSPYGSPRSPRELKLPRDDSIARVRRAALDIERALRHAFWRRGETTNVAFPLVISFFMVMVDIGV
jgi:hypothetical protein